MIIIICFYGILTLITCVRYHPLISFLFNHHLIITLFNSIFLLERKNLLKKIEILTRGWRRTQAILERQIVYRGFNSLLYYLVLHKLSQFRQIRLKIWGFSSQTRSSPR